MFLTSDNIFLIFDSGVTTTFFICFCNDLMHIMFNTVVLHYSDFCMCVCVFLYLYVIFLQMDTVLQKTDRMMAMVKDLFGDNAQVCVPSAAP